MKILLINPPVKSANPREPILFPLGLGYLAAALRREGFHPVILDARLGSVRKQGRFYHIGLTIPEILNEIRQAKPDLVGVSVPFISRQKTAIELGQAIRQAYPDLPLVAGGIQATVTPQPFLQNGFDAVLLGETEASFPEFLRNFPAAKSPPVSDGIALRRNGDIEVIPQTRIPLELDTLSFPARDLLPFDVYLKRSQGRWTRRGTASMITSRGCPYRCTFCCIHRLTGRKYRKRSADNVLEEISELVHRYGAHNIAFEDDNLIADRNRAVRIFEAITAGFPRLTWLTPNGISIRNLDRDLLVLMKKAGCRSVNLAFESGDPDILRDAMHKDLDPEEGRQARGWCKELGIAVNGYFVLGMPGETPQSMRRTRDYALSLDLDGIGISIAMPFPGTELYDLCIEKGYLNGGDLPVDTRFDADPEVLHYPLIETPLLKRAELLAFHDEFYKQFMRHYFSRRPHLKLRRSASQLLSRLVPRR